MSEERIEPTTGNFWWKFLILPEAEKLSEVTEEIAEIADELLECLEEVFVPKTVNYKYRDLPNQDFSLKDFYGEKEKRLPSESYEGKVELDERAVSEIISEEDLKKGYTLNLHLEGDAKIEFDSGVYELNSDSERCEYEGDTSFPLFRVEIRFHPYENSEGEKEVVYHVNIWTKSPVWYEDSELGERNRERLANSLRRILDNWDTVIENEDAKLEFVGAFDKRRENIEVDPEEFLDEEIAVFWI